MTYDPKKHHRHSIRLKGYDYSLAGAYFITICTRNRECLFGQIVNGAMQLNAAGQMIERWWAELMHKFPSVETDAYVVMPNHFHGVLSLSAGGQPPEGRPPLDEQPHRVAPTGSTKIEMGRPTLGDIMDWFKTMTTNEYIRRVKQDGWPRFVGKLWQRNYYEHIIRDERDLCRIRDYICNNAARWQEDTNNPGKSNQHPKGSS